MYCIQNYKKKNLRFNVVCIWEFLLLIFFFSRTVWSCSTLSAKSFFGFLLFFSSRGCRFCLLADCSFLGLCVCVPVI
uniref:Putative secreted protein n=1 Tax=Ixodes scapularis TaxID=6945 RepID=A0A4D5RFV9_IXOSC